MQIIWIPFSPFIIACEKSDHKSTKKVLLRLTFGESGFIDHSEFTWVANSKHTYGSNRQALPDNTPTHIPRCSLDSAMETAWKLMTQTEKDKERGEGISEMSGTPCCWHCLGGRGLFSEVLVLDFPTGALTIQCSLGAAAFLESPRMPSETHLGVGVSPDVLCPWLLAQGPGLMLGIDEGGEALCLWVFPGPSHFSLSPQRETRFSPFPCFKTHFGPLFPMDKV